MAQSAKTRALDRLDVREGRLSSQALSWFSEEYAQSLALTVPDYSSLVLKGCDGMAGFDSCHAQRNRGGCSAPNSKPAMTRLFLDCEWADPEGKQLVSLALVDAVGGTRFYGEIDPLPETATSFVKETVYPLLERGESAKSTSELAAALRLFLAQLPEPRLVFADHPVDFTLLANALGGFGEGFTGNMPAWQAVEVTQGDVLMCRDMYFDLHPEARKRQHHAGVDVEALRWGFESVINGGSRVDRRG